MGVQNSLNSGSCTAKLLEIFIKKNIKNLNKIKKIIKIGVPNSLNSTNFGIFFSILSKTKCKVSYWQEFTVLIQNFFLDVAF
jgi:uncharacterized protein YegL